MQGEKREEKGRRKRNTNCSLPAVTVEKGGREQKRWEKQSLPKEKERRKFYTAAAAASFFAK